MGTKRNRGNKINKMKSLYAKFSFLLSSQEDHHRSSSTEHHHESITTSFKYLTRKKKIVCVVHFYVEREAWHDFLFVELILENVTTWLSLTTLELSCQTRTQKATSGHGVKESLKCVIVHANSFLSPCTNHKL